MEPNTDVVENQRFGEVKEQHDGNSETEIKRRAAFRKKRLSQDAKTDNCLGPSSIALTPVEV